MKTSIFDMTFVLPPLIEMHEVTKDMPMAAGSYLPLGTGWYTFCVGDQHENIYL